MKLTPIDLTTEFCGITSPNPFWLASAPPTNTGGQVMRAFEAGWGGAVWKTLGKPITNVSSRFGAVDYLGTKVMGFNNIELITDRPLDVNLKEMAETKKRFPKHTLVASLMVETRDEWRDIIKAVEDVGSDAIELNFGCPHGMCERGMGSAVGQEPKVLERITGWAKEFARIPVIVKLTPNITDVNRPAEAALRGGADAVSLINTIKSIVHVDLDTFSPMPSVAGKGTNGGYCGPAVKPIALHMVASIARNEPTHRLPISGIGGVSTWRDAVEFMVLGATNVQVCTAVMHYGYRIIDDLTAGLQSWMREKGIRRVNEITGKAVGNYMHWGELDQSYHHVAEFHEEHCIGCNLCVVACDDGGHQCLTTAAKAGRAGGPGLNVGMRKTPVIHEPECVGCNLCELVCPSPGAITMRKVPRTSLHGH